MIIYISENNIKLNDIQIPGILQSISVSGTLIYEAKEQIATTNRIKSITGFDDATVEISLLLTQQRNLTSGEIEKTDYIILEEINSLFKKIENGYPVVYLIKNQHINARGIKKVLFSELNSEETNNGLICTLKFIETESITKTIQQQQIDTTQIDKKVKQKIKEIKDARDTLSKQQKKEINKLIEGKLNK